MSWFILGFIIGFIVCLLIINDKYSKVEDENCKLRKENRRLNRMV